MSVSKEACTAVGTIALAVGIGFVMQSTETAKKRYGVEEPTPPQLSQEEEIVPLRESSILRVDSIELTSASVSTTNVLPGKTSNFELAAVADDSEVEDTTNAVQSCLITGLAEAQLAAIVSLKVDAPCRPNARFTVHHQGMMFTGATDDDGQAKLFVPALTGDAVFIVSFQQGVGAIATSQVADIDKFDRTVLQWRGQTGFELHAREFGATYGENGHVWSGAEQSLSGLVAGENGYVQRLGLNDGSEGYYAEVYSYPVESSQHVGLINITVEAQVSLENCGRNIAAQSLEHAEGALRTQDLTLSVPPCDTVGSYMVLNNLVSDLKVAAK
ncbi:MAG: hypothetical protein ABJD13_04020 [Paracoccaceae bacterium]